MTNNDDEGKKTATDVVNNFIVTYRKFFIILISVLIVAAIAVGIFMGVKKTINQKGFASLDEITFEFSSAKQTLTGDELTAKETEIAKKAIELADANKKNSVGARAYMFAADVDFQKKNWEQARALWISAAEANKKAYTSALSYYNAAICSEELADLESAIKYFEIASENKDFSLKNKALFQLGRVQEENNAFADAVKTYNKLCDVSPDDSYASLAKSRIISLQAEEKAE